MIKIAKTIITAALLLLLVMPLSTALADSSSQVFGACPPKGSGNPAANNPVCQSQNTTQNPVIHVINVAANLIGLIAGLAAVIMIITSGLTMITSNGNQETVANARKRIVAAAIGLVIIVLAWSIVRFVTDKVIG